MTLRYGAIVHALASLRGELDSIPPSESAVRYHPHRHRGIEPLADLYVPNRPNGASVVLVHGGAFVIGSRRMKPVRFLAARLCAAQIAVCAIDYRMIFRGGRLDEAIDDVSAALAFWHERAGQLGLDPHRLSLAGLSAGATLAMLAAARPSNTVARLACCFGLYELAHLRGPVGELLPRFLFRSAERASWDARAPRNAAQPTVPTLLLHGTDDGLVPVEQARRLAAHREGLGLPTRLVVYEGAPHGFFNRPSPACDDGVRELVAHVSD